MLRGAYSDRENQGCGEFLKSLFPEQTKTLPRIIIWSFIFLIDLMLVAFGTFYLGFEFSKWLIVVVFIGSVFLFWLQGYIWSTILKLFR